MSQHDATRLPLEDDLKMMNEQMKDREPSEIEQEYNSTYFTARPPTLKQWLIERTRALTQEVATLKAERDTATAQFTEHTKVVGRFLYDMYATMIDPVEECNLKVAELCELLLKQAGEDREQLAALATLRSENEKLRVSMTEWWFKEARPIIDAIGEISVQEAMDAIERSLA